jgi:spore coat protein U-like protein
MRRSLAAGLVALTFLAAPAAEAACGNLRFAATPGVVDYRGAGGGYGVFDPAARTQAVTIQVARNGASSCGFYVTASAGSSGSYLQRRLDGAGLSLAYNLYADASLARPLRDGVGAAGGLVGAYAQHDPELKTLTYYFDVPPGQTAEPGEAADAIDLKLYDDSDRLVQSVRVTHRARVAAAADLSIVPTGAGFDPSRLSHAVSFGELAPGKRADFDLRVRGNNGFSVTMQSAGGGALRPTAAGATGSVPYTLSVGGATIPLAGGGAVPVAASAIGTDAEGLRFPVAIVIGAVEVEAGTYADTVTVVVTAK